jgi:hypothetical protein
LIEEVRLGALTLLPAADAHANEPDRLFRQPITEEELPGGLENVALVVGRSGPLVLPRVRLESREAGARMSSPWKVNEFESTEPGCLPETGKTLSPL